MRPPRRATRTLLGECAALILAVGLLTGPLSFGMSAGLSAPRSAPCRFSLGFAALREAVGPAVVGDCLADEAHDENGDARQSTANGKHVWRKAGNTAAFTNGRETWVLEPAGIRRRPNDQRFAWEPDAADFPPADELPGDPATGAEASH